MRFPETLALCLLAATPALAGDPVGTPNGEARAVLIDGWRRGDGSRMAAIEISLAPGWHTYWRVPGESGIPPEFDWSHSANLASVSYQWPRPMVFDSGGGRGFGYSGDLVLPVILTPADPSQPIRVDLRLFFGVCGQICVPADLRLQTDIAPDQSPDGEARIKAALAQMPRGRGEAGITAVTCAIRPGPGGYQLTTEVTFAEAPTRDQVAVIEPGGGNLWIGLPSSETVGRKLVSHAPLETTDGGGPMLDRSALRLTLLDPEGAVDIQGCAAPG